MAIRYFRPGELDQLLASKDRVTATKYAHSVLSNKDSPVSNKQAVADYMSAHPEKFLTQADIDANPGILAPKPRARIPFFGGRSRAPRVPIDQPRSVEQLSKTVNNLKDPLRQRLYLEQIRDNPASNPTTVQNAKDLLNLNRDRFASDDEVAAYRFRQMQKASEPRQYSGSNRSSWSRFWKPKEEYDRMTSTQKRFFSMFYKKRNPQNNASLALGVIANPKSTEDDKAAVIGLVQENRGMFFKDNRRRFYRRYSNRYNNQ